MYLQGAPQNVFKGSPPKCIYREPPKKTLKLENYIKRLLRFIVEKKSLLIKQIYEKRLTVAC